MTDAETQLAAALPGAMLASRKWTPSTIHSVVNDAWWPPDDLARAILAALAQHGLTVARSDDAEVGAALREAREALPDGWVLKFFQPQRGGWCATAGADNLRIDNSGDGPTPAAAARALTAELRKEE